MVPAHLAAIMVVCAMAAATAVFSWHPLHSVFVARSLLAAPCRGRHFNFPVANGGPVPFKASVAINPSRLSSPDVPEQASGEAGVAVRDLSARGKRRRHDPLFAD